MLSLIPSKRRENLFGVGILDAGYAVFKRDGTRCPYYLAWRGMLMRCYDKRFVLKNPCYVGCSVASEWIMFSNFKRWMQKQNWEGMVLEKDIIKLGNKIYCPELCRFVTQETNGFVSGSQQSGPLPIGIHLRRGKYAAQCMFNKKNIYIGSFSTLLDASSAYLTVKMEEFDRVISLQSDEQIITGLVAHARRIISDHEAAVNNLEQPIAI